MLGSIDVVVEDRVQAFSLDDLHRVRQAGYDCNYYEMGNTNIVVLWVPDGVCDNTVVRALRGNDHKNMVRRRDLYG